jgi:hypothetical protein
MASAPNGRGIGQAALALGLEIQSLPALLGIASTMAAKSLRQS